MDGTLSRILLFDSGVGGLSIYHELKATLPDCEYHYYADHIAAPYGNKNDKWLDQRINLCLKSLNQTLDPDIIIIACNTASTLSLESLRSAIKTHIVGVVPAIKTASEKSKNNAIGLLATPATINRRYIDNLIKNYAESNTVIKVGSTRMVDIAEQKLSGTHPSPDELRRIISPLTNANCKSIVLGCTHFPLLKSELQTIAPDINWIDSGTAIAKRVKVIIANNNLNTKPQASTFYSSSNLNASLIDYITKIGFKNVIPHHAFELDPSNT